MEETKICRKTAEQGPPPSGGCGHYARKLNDEEMDKLKQQDSRLVTEFKQNKLEKEAEKSWDLFYKRNTTKFYKDRHWTTREFEDLCGKKQDGGRTRIFECGCGVGNFMFPVLEENPDTFFYACDFSQRAVQFVEENRLYNSARCRVFQCDLTKDDVCNNVPPDSCDIVTLIFVLSAIHPNKMLTVLQKLCRVLKTGGCVLFRDYGLYDQAMIRFSAGSKLGENFYVRQDNTRAYYFSEEQLASLFQSAGFVVDKNEYVLRETVNKKEGICVPRVFIQGKFIKC